MKECTKCEENKPLEEYYSKTTGKDGKASMCKVCYRKARQRNYRNPPPLPQRPAGAMHYKDYLQQGGYAVSGKNSIYRKLKFV